MNKRDMKKDAELAEQCYVNPSEFDYKKYAALIRSNEREECAKFCETNQVWVGQGKRGFSKWGEEDFVAGGRHQGMDYADAIRARSKA